MGALETQNYTLGLSYVKNFVCAKSDLWYIKKKPQEKFVSPACWQARRHWSFE
jgi:hypothetical protein